MMIFEEMFLFVDLFQIIFSHSLECYKNSYIIPSIANVTIVSALYQDKLDLYIPHD